MTFSIRVKEEISKLNVSPIDALVELSSFLKHDGVLEKNRIILTIENASIARRTYKHIKGLYNININIIVRNQRRFRLKQIYILEIKEKIDQIIEDLKINKNDYHLETKEEEVSYLRGLFLACGSITDPASNGYHMEFAVKLKKDADLVIGLLKDLNIPAKTLKRKSKYMVYIKESEKISDVLKLFNATNSLFYFEDIRIYRDHKNMVNRLNNCEIANQEKTISTGIKQVENIEYLEQNDLLNLLDDKTQIVLNYRKKYPETSYQELADIISLETDYKIGKSGVNHHFIKMNKLVERHLNKDN